MPGGFNYDQGGGQSAPVFSNVNATRVSFSRASGGPTNLSFWTSDAVGLVAPPPDRRLSTAIVVDAAAPSGIVGDVVQALETDVAQPVGRVKVRTLGLVLETATPQPVARRKVRAAAQAFETDAATATGRVRARTAAQALETDVAQPTARAKRHAALQALETDTAQPIVRRKVLPIGPGAVYTDAFADLERWDTVYGPFGGASGAAASGRAEITLPSGTGFRALQLAYRRSVDLTRGSARMRVGADSPALPHLYVTPASDPSGAANGIYFSTASYGWYSPSVFPDYPHDATATPYLRVREQDGTVYFETATSAGGPWTTLPNTVATSDVPWIVDCRLGFYGYVNALTASTAVAWADSVELAEAESSETDTARPIVRVGPRIVGQALETDAAQPVGRRHVKTVAQAAGAEAAQPVGRRKVRTLGQATSSSTPQPVGRVKVKTLGQPSETDIARPVAPAGKIIVTVGQATETDTARPITRRPQALVNRVLETDAAQPVTVRRVKTIGQAVEASSATAVLRLSRLTVGQAVEAANAQAVTRVRRYLVGQAVEINEALGLVVRPPSDYLEATVGDATLEATVGDATLEAGYAAV